MSESKFKVGDEVVWVKNGFTFGDRKIITKIVSVTPLRGLCKIVGTNACFNEDGIEVRKGYNRDHIIPVTQELREEIGHANLSRRLNNYSFDKLSLPQLREVAKLVGEFDKQNLPN